MSTEKEEIDGLSEEAVVNTEVEWGRTYRHQKRQGRRVSLVPTPSPFNIQKLWEQYQMSKELREIKELKRKLLMKPIPVITKLPKGRVDPDTVSKKVYYNYMSTPRRYPEPPPLPLRPKHCKEECSPRLIYLSLPTKVRVLHTWKDHRFSLPIDFITRLEELLHTDHNLDPQFARCYFKTLDRLKKKQRNRLRKKQKRRKRQQRRESKEWLKMQIKLTTDLLIKFLKKEPLFSLNFKQMMLSETILNALHEHGDIKNIPPRNSNKPYSRAVIDIVDQLAVWIDTIVRYVDVQYTESLETIGELPSIGSELEMEEEEEEEEEEEQEKPARFSLPPLPSLPDMPPLPDVPDIPHISEEAEGAETPTYETSTFDGVVGVPEDVSEETVGNLTLREDALEMLIQILSYSSPDMLQQLVNPEVLPNITYKDILDRLHDLRDQTKSQMKKDRAAALEEAMIAWAKSNQPDKVDRQIVGKIQHAAGILSECLDKEKRRLSMPANKTDTSASGESSFNPPTTEVEHTASGDVTTEEIPGDLSEDVSDAIRTLETLQEEGIASATSGHTASHYGEGEGSIESRMGAVRADESKTKLPTIVSAVSNADQDISEVSKLDMGSELKVVMGEVSSPELSQYVLGMIAEEEVKKSVPSVAPATSTPSGAPLPPASSAASLPSKTPTAPFAPAASSGASLPSNKPTAPSAPSLPSKTPTVPSGASLPSKTSTAPSVPPAPSGASLPSQTPTTPSAPAAASLPSKTPPALSGASLPSKTPAAPSRVSLPPAVPPAPPSGVSMLSSVSVPSRIPGVTIPEGVSKTSIPFVIPGHKPSKVFEHQPDTICCLTLKVWATWLLEVAHNAHAWSRWLNDIINEVRRIASIIRGDVKDEAGNPVVFYKEDWIEFSGKVDNMITSWRQYSMHVKDLTDKIVHNFHGKTVTCCPKCLEDNLIVDVSLAHNISQQLAEAMNTAGYWRRWLDSVVMETKRLTGATLLDNESQASNYGTMELIELHEARAAESEQSLYEIEELDPTHEPTNRF